MNSELVCGEEKEDVKPSLRTQRLASVQLRSLKTYYAAVVYGPYMMSVLLGQAGRDKQRERDRDGGRKRTRDN